MPHTNALTALKRAMDDLEIMPCTSIHAPEFIAWRADADTALCELEGEESPLLMGFRTLQFAPVTHHEHKGFAWRINKRYAMEILTAASLDTLDQDPN